MRGKLLSVEKKVCFSPFFFSLLTGALFSSFGWRRFSFCSTDITFGYKRVAKKEISRRWMNELTKEEKNVDSRFWVEAMKRGKRAELSRVSTLAFEKATLVLLLPSSHTWVRPPTTTRLTERRKTNLAISDGRPSIVFAIPPAPDKCTLALVGRNCCPSRESDYLICHPPRLE